MALDESTNGLKKLESNGVEAWIDPGLEDALQKQFGDINIDFLRRPEGGGGYTIRAGDPADCAQGGCDGCG
jgi:hypothetical protein